MRITSKPSSFISMLMKYLKVTTAILFKILVRFYILTETIYEDGKQKRLQFSWNNTHLGYKLMIMGVLIHVLQSPLEKIMKLFSMLKMSWTRALQSVIRGWGKIMWSEKDVKWTVGDINEGLPVFRCLLICSFHKSVRFKVRICSILFSWF